MFVLLILFSRYLFVFYIISFLCYCLRKDKLLAQKGIIYSMHVTAFAILAFDKNSLAIKMPVIYIGLASLLVLIFIGVSGKFIYKGSNPKIWNCVCFLLSIGIVTLTRLNVILAEKQIIWLFVGVVASSLMPPALKFAKKLQILKDNLFSGIYSRPKTFFKDNSEFPVTSNRKVEQKVKFFSLASIIVMLGSVVFLGREEYGAVIGINLFGFSFQPAEIVKLIFVFYLASTFYDINTSIKSLIVPTCVSAAIVLLQVYLRDLGGALIFFVTYMIIMYIATGKIILFFAGFTMASIASVLAYRLFYHVRVRVSAWSNPWADPTNNGYQLVQGFFSIGTYGLMGSGLSLGYPHYVPVVERDFIFAAICEEFGSLFGGLLIIVYIVMFYLLIKIALNAADKFFSLLIVGIVTVLAFQSFLILGGIVKLIPLTGVTLPFISYGGSSLTACILMISVAQLNQISTVET